MMEFVIYALLVASGFVMGWFVGSSKKTDPAPILVEQPPKKRAYVRKEPVVKRVKGTKSQEAARTASEAGVVLSTDATVNVSKIAPVGGTASLPNGQYKDSYLQHE